MRLVGMKVSASFSKVISRREVWTKFSTVTITLPIIKLVKMKKT